MKWILNFDAEYEMRHRSRGAAYTPTTFLKKKVGELQALWCRQTGIPLDDVVKQFAIDLTGQRSLANMWCVTENALSLAERLGLVVPPLPAPEVVRRVNERGFAIPLQNEDSFVSLPMQSVEHVAQAVRAEGRTIDANCADPSNPRWLLKCGFSVASREQRVISAHLSPDDVQWIEGSLRGDSLYLEPFVNIEAEFSVHGWVAEDGRVVLGTINRQLLSHGRWNGSQLATAHDLRPNERAMLGRRAHNAGTALFSTGYFGPFGVDSYVYRNGKGIRKLRSVSEINARFCMGWHPNLDGLLPP